jgi:hypothetical protein
MKITQSLLFAILLGLLLCACAKSTPSAAIPLPESMKGYELYSWQENDQWKFSLLIGTNREKTLDEIKSSDMAILSVETLLTLLNTFPSGQTISWSLKETLTFPPQDIISQIEQTCKDTGITLNIAP